MRANERQIGGDHYSSGYQHWDFVATIPLDYFAGNATRYVSRWRKKHGIEDLEKGLHYTDKLIEVTKYDETRNFTRNEIAEEVQRFVLANKLTDAEHNCILILSTFQNQMELTLARTMISALIEEARAEQPKHEEQSGPGTPDNGGHHSTQPQD